MALTRDFRETVKAHCESDPGFRKALLARAAQAMLAGETRIALAVSLTPILTISFASAQLTACPAVFE